MAITEILPINNSSPDYTVDIELSTVIYRFGIKWNTNNEYWVMSLFDTDDNPIITGIKIVTDFDLLKICTNELKPVGNIYCFDTSNSKLEPTFESLGDTHIIVYQVE